jgi:di- and tripeptidase
MLLVTLPGGSEVEGVGGEMLLSGGGDGVVKLWALDPKTSKIRAVKSLSGGDLGVLSMAVNDTLLYCGLTDGEICIWDLDTLQSIRVVKSHCDDVLTMCVVGCCIFSGSASGSSRVYTSYIPFTISAAC